MPRFKKLPTKNHEEKITYGEGIVDSIVYIAVSELYYTELYSNVVYKKNHSESIKVEFTKDGVVVDVDVNIHFSQSVSDMSFKIQETIRHSIESMTEYHVAGVNVNVRDVVFDDSLLPSDKKQNNATLENQTEESGVVNTKKATKTEKIQKPEAKPQVENTNVEIKDTVKEVK